MLKGLGVSGTVVLIDVDPDERLQRSVRNIPGVSLLASNRVTARDVVGAERVIATTGALEKLQAVLAPSGAPPSEPEVKTPRGRRRRSEQ
jgi:large subunit ribosomal protein L4